MTYIVIVAIVIAVVVILARSSKKRVSANMSNLANAGKVIAYVKLQEKLNSDIGTHQFGADNDSLGLFAAAGINQIFGEELNEQHRMLDLDSLRNYVNKWISSNPDVQELVVQSIRTLHTVNYARTGSLSSKGIETLESYGSKYPDAPNRDNLSALVNTGIDKLSVEHQSTIRNRFHVSR